MNRDMLRILFILIMAFLLSGGAPALAQYRSDAVYEDIYDSETMLSMKNHVRTLSSALMEGRKAGSAGERMAAEYVRECFRESGVDVLTLPEGDSFGVAGENGDTLTSCNVVGYVQGYDRTLRDRYVVVGARLDNLGSMTMTVDGNPVERIYYGANGNATGIAMLLELASKVNTNSVLFRRSVIFVAFGASSHTYAGAWYFLNRAFSGADDIDAMINLDMLGTGYNGFYAYTSSNADMNAVIRTLTGELQPVLPEIVSSEPYPSDHRAFYAEEIPSVMFTTGRYPEHNTDKDTQSIVDFEMMERELEYIYNFTVALANASSAPSFSPAAVSSGKTSGDDVLSYYDCDQRPEFLNSADPRQFLEKWVYKYLKYPPEALIDGTQGRVMVEFVIGKDGKVGNVRVVKSVSEELDAEAVKVVSASPKWRPGRVKGNKVSTSMTIPVEFRLEKKGSRSKFGIKK